MIVVTKRNARHALLASTALIAAVAALPARAQMQVASPQDGGVITGAGTETVEDNTAAGGSLYITGVGAPITFTDVTITNTTGAGATVGQAANALGLVNTSSGQSIVLTGSNSFSTTQPGGTAFRAQTIFPDVTSNLNVTMNGGAQSFSGTDGLHLRAFNAVNVVNTGGLLTATATGQYGVYSRANGGASTLNLGTVAITAAAGTGIYAYGFDGTNVTTSGGTIAAEAGIAVYASGVGTISSGSAITGNGNSAATSIGIGAYGEDATSRIEITSNAAISNFYKGIYLQNQTGLAGNVIRVNANIDAISAGIDTGNSAATDIHVGAGATVRGGTTGIVRSSTGTTYNSGTIRGAVGVSNTVASTIENSGLIEGTTTAVNFLAGGTLTNNANASITSGVGGINVAGGVGTITNRGTISAGNGAGIMLNAGGTATNYATITAVGNGSTGLRSTGAASTLDNRGTITANIGIRTDASGSVLNNSGTINATSFAIYVPSGTVTLTNSGTVNGAVGATLNGGGSITNTGSLIGGSYGITAAGAATTVVNDGTISGGSGGMTLSTFNDTVTLGAASTTIGDINLSTGNDTLNIMSGATFGALAGGNGTDTLVLGGTTTGVLNLATTATFEVLNKTGTGTWTLNGAALSPAMAITAGNGTPSGTLVFNGTGLTGAITVNGATIRATSAGGFGTGAITALDPTIQYGATGTYTNQIILASTDPVNDPTRLETDSGVVATLTGQLLEQGTGQPLVVGGAGTIVLTNQNNFWSGGTTILAGATLQGSGTAFGNGYNPIVNNGTLIFDETGSYSQYSTISGSGDLIKRGGGTRVLSTANSYTGATTIEAGTLEFRSNLSLSNTSGIALTGATAVLDNNSADGAVLNNLSGVAGSQVLLRGKSTTLANSTNTIFAGTLSGTSSGGITKAGSGKLTLSGNNASLTAPVLINAGIVALVDGGSLANAGYIAVNGGAFDISGVGGGGTSIKDLRGSGGSVVLGDKLLTISAAAYGNNFAGVISGTGGVSLSSGVLTLAAANTYSGNTVIALGAQFNLSGAGSIANSDVTANGYFMLIDSDATVRSFSGTSGMSAAFLSGHTLTIANGGAYAGQFNGGALNLTGGTLILTGGSSVGTIALNGGNLTLGDGGTSGFLSGTTVELNNGTYTINRSDNYAVGNLSGAGNFAQAGTGTTEIWNSTYTGTTTVAAGTLQLDYGNAIADTSDLIVLAGATARLFAAGTETIGSLSGAGSFDLNGNSLAVTNGGNFSGVISNGGDLTVVGGTLTLSGTNTYVGTTYVAQGAGLTLGTGGTTGSVAGALSVDGTLTVNRSDNVTLQSLSSGTGSFVQAGTGITRLSGVGGFTGTTTIQAGTLALEDAGALQSSSLVSLTGSGALLDVGMPGSTTTIKGLAGVAGSTVRYGEAGMRVTMSGNALFAGSFDDVSTASGALHLEGTGIFTLAGQSNVKRIGITDVTVAMSGSGSLGTDTAVNLLGGRLDLSGVTGGSYRLGNLYGNLGTVALGGTTLTIANGADAFLGSIEGTGGLRIAGGAYTLYAPQDYTGATQIDSGATLLLIGTGSFASKDFTVDGTLNINDLATPLSLTSLSGSGTVQVGMNSLTIAQAGFGGVITGTLGGVTIESGTQFVTQDWTYIGTTTLLANANLTLGDGGTEGSVGGHIVLNGGTLTTNRSNNLTVAGLSGSGSFVQAGAGETTLSAGSGFTGDVIVSGGKLTVSGDTLANAASVALTGAGTTLNAGGISTATINNLSGVAGSAVQIGSKGLTAVNSNSTVFAGTLTSSGTPFSNASLTKSGTGMLTLTGANTLTSVEVDEGMLALSGAGSLGDGARVNVSGGTLDLSGITSGATAFTLLDGAGTVNLGATRLTLLNPAGLMGGQFDGVIQGTGGLTIAAGNQFLTSTNTYSGDTVIDAGATLSLVSYGTVIDPDTGIEIEGASISNSAVTANGTFDIRYTNGQVVVAGLSGSGSVLLGTDWFRVGSNNADSSFSGTLSGGNARFWKEGLGTLTLSGVSDLSRVSVFDGTLALVGDASLGANAEVSVVFGTFDISGINGPSLAIADLSEFGSVQLGDKTLEITNGSQSYGGQIEGTGGVHISGGYGTFGDLQLYTGLTTIDAGASLYLVGFDGALTGAAQVDGTLDISLHAGQAAIGGLSGSGTVELGPDNRSLTINGGGSFSGSIHGDGALVFAGGTTTLSGANDYTSATRIESGATLALSGGGTVGTGAVIADGLFDISGTTAGATIGNLSGTGNVSLGANTLSLGTDGQDSAFAGVIGGSGGLTKLGTGVLTLSGQNTYSGLTSVQEGTLRLGAAGVLADDSTLEVRGGATLDMNGFDETVASFTIEGNLIGSGTLTAALYNFLGGTIDHDLGGGAIHQISGTTLLNGSSAGSAVHVEGGTLVLGANDRLADTATLDVASGATLDLQGYNDTVGSATLAGTLAGNGTLTAGTYTLDGALVDANLRTGTLIQRSGTSLLNGTAATGTVNVTGGTLQLGANDRLLDTAAVGVAAGTSLDLEGFSDTVGSLALSGTLSGTGTLTAGTYTLDGATVDANLGTGTLVQRSGVSFLNGTAATGTVNVTGGTLQLGASDRLADNAVVTVASGTTLALQGFNDTIGSLALAGTLSGTGTLTATTYTLDSATVDADLGTGTLIQRSGTSLLNGTAVTEAARVEGGTLRLGASDRLVDTATVSVAAGTVLDLQGFNDTIASLALSGTLAGTGTLTAATYTLDSAAVNANLGAGTLVQHSGSSLLNGTVAAAAVNITGGALRLGASDRLANTATVSVAAGTSLDLQGFSDTIDTLSLAGTLSGTGTLTATTYTLDNATVNANLGAGTLVQHSGTSLLNGTAATQVVNIDAGTLRLGAADRLADSAAVSVATGTTLDLQSFNDTIGSLALNGMLSGTGTLSATSYTLNGATVIASLAGGTLTQAGGTSVLAGTVTGANAGITGGTLRIGNGGTSGWLNGNIAVGGALVFDRSDAVAYAGALSGTGSVTQAQGSLTLGGNSAGFAGSFTASGASLTVNGQLGGTGSSLHVASGTLAGTGSIGGAVTLAEGAHLVGTSGSTLSMGSLLLSSGSIVDATLSQPSASALFAVAGDLTLDGTLNVTTQPGYGAGIYRLFSYGGTLTDKGLALGTGTGGVFLQTAAAGQVNLINSAGVALSFWDGGAAVNHDNGQIEGGIGTWSLGGRNWTDPNGALNGAMAPVPAFAVFQGSGGTVTIDNGAGQVGATGMQFASIGYTLSGGALALSGTQAIVRVGDGTAAGASINATIASALTGSAALVKTDLGTLTLTGANSYTGGTIVQAGTLVGNADSIRGAVQNAGTVVFDQGSDASFAGTISGAGSYVKSGAGALTLTAASSSDWRVTAGSLVSTSTLFAGNLDLGAGTSFVFDQTTNGSYAGTLTGSGSVLFRGGGTVLLTGNSSGFGGTTKVGGGSASLLSVNGTLGGMVDVLAGGRLQGNGTIGSGRIAGTIAPGNSIGTLTVAGNLSFLAGSVYEVEANAAGQSDKIVVNGSASIQNGATVSVLATDGNYAPNTSYTILTAAGGLTGTFSNVTSNLAFLKASLTYGATSVTLNLARNSVDFAAVAQTSNQRGVGAAVQALGSGNAVYDATVALTAAEARVAFDQLSGSDYASMRGRLIEDSGFVRDALLTRGSLAGEEGLSVWGTALGTWGSMDGGALAQGYDRDLKGMLAGFDAGFGGHWRAGLATGYGRTELRSGNATHNADSYHAGGYLTGSYGMVTLQMGAAYAWNDIRSQRRVAFGGLAQTLGDRYRANSLQAFGEVALKRDLNGVSVQPFAGLAYVRLQGSDIAEQGGAAALHGGKQGESMTYGTFGLRTGTALDLGGKVLRFKGSAALRHAFGDTLPTVDLGFAAGPGFVSAGNALDRDSAAVDAGLELDLGKFVTLGVSYVGSYGERATDHGARAALSWRF